jgi:hypothetical protein
MPLMDYTENILELYNHKLCMICLADFEKHDEIRIIKLCKHFFHSECLLMWIRKEESCPLCKKSLQKEDCSAWESQAESCVINMQIENLFLSGRDRCKQDGGHIQVGKQARLKTEEVPGHSQKNKILARLKMASNFTTASTGGGGDQFLPLDKYSPMSWLAKADSECLSEDGEESEDGSGDFSFDGKKEKVSKVKDPQRPPSMSSSRNLGDLKAAWLTKGKYSKKESFSDKTPIEGEMCQTNCTPDLFGTGKSMSVNEPSFLSSNKNDDSLMPINQSRSSSELSQPAIKVQNFLEKYKQLAT